MKNINIPIPVIVLCFIFGAWPIGVFLIILRTISESNKEEAKKSQNSGKGSQSSTMHTVYHSKYAESEQNKTEPDTTYHYSYIKKDTAKDTDAANAANKSAATAEPQKKTATVPQMKTAAGTGAPTVGMAGASNTANAARTLKKKHKVSAATVLTTVFMGISMFFAAVFFIDLVTTVIDYGIGNSTGAIISTMISSSIAAILYLFRQYYKSRDYRIITYLSVLRDKKFYSIKTLAEIADVPVSRVIKDLQYMLAKDLFGPYALIDKKMQYLIITADGREGAVAEYERLNGDRQTARAERAEAKKAAAEDLTENEKILARIRELNDDIDDETVSMKIDEIEELTRKIFKLVEEKPELKSHLDSFLSYYLPTTLKLLNSYAYFEEQGVRGDNINAGMKNIEETLDMLVSGYRHQLDKLFESDTLDVTTDINVLGQMMKADGFTNYSDFNLTTETEFTSGASSAAAVKPDDQNS